MKLCANEKTQKVVRVLQVNGQVTAPGQFCSRFRLLA